jgi:hypothetical protein
MLQDRRDAAFPSQRAYRLEDCVVISKKAMFAALFLAVAAALCGFASTTLSGAQSTKPQKPPRLTFEVASIRPSKPGTLGGVINRCPAGMDMSCRTCR